jgi:4-hydroxythreonine-4-phosphate dehydrogenase
MSNKKVIVGISHGDINSLNYEVIIKTFQDNRIFDFCTPVIYGSPKVAAYYRKALNINNFNFNSINSINLLHHKKANLINCINDDIRVDLGKPSLMADESAIASLDCAVEDLKNNKIDVLVTTPINKESMKTNNLNFENHTLYLMDKFDTKNTLTIMINKLMRISVVADNLPVKDVANQITEENILDKLRLLNKSLIENFNIRGPKIAILSLNPKGTNGISVGSEEEEIIIPAVNKANDEGIVALGPYFVDDLFESDSFTKFDAILAMYHDQGVAPFKTLNFETSVNYTYGLPIIRTAPDQNVVYGAVGNAKADSLREAIYTACDLFKNSVQYNELTKNSLKKQTNKKI